MKWRCGVPIALAVLSVMVVPQPRVTVQRVRLADWLSYSLADRKVLPNISDLKGHSLHGEVFVQILISKTGDVTHARGVKGDTALLKRSEEAALKWHYKPYVLNGTPIEADSMLTFRFRKNSVEVVVPPH